MERGTASIQDKKPGFDATVAGWAIIPQMNYRGVPSIVSNIIIHLVAMETKIKHLPEG